MSIIHRKLQVHHSAADMYRLVNDVNAYKDFLPWCKESRVLSENENEIHAALTLAAGGLQKSFTTCNRLQPTHLIEITLVNGPFRHLEGFWRFEDEGEKISTVQFDLEFEFSSKFLSLAFSPVFHQVANTLVDAFAKRAEQLYK